MKPFVAAVLGISTLLVSCGEPPTYVLTGTEPVRVNGRQCRAEHYSVEYTSAVYAGFGVIGTESGEQYKVQCGATTISCTLNQSLEDCVRLYEQRSRDDDDGGYQMRG